MYTYVCLKRSKMNDSNGLDDGKEELGMFCHYKVLTLLVRGFSVI